MAAQSTGPIVPGTGLEWTGLAIGAALLAGTSAYGRRGGIFGTLLAVAGLTLFLDYAAAATSTSRCSRSRPCASAPAWSSPGWSRRTAARCRVRPRMTDWNAAGRRPAPPLDPEHAGDLVARSGQPPESRPARWDDGPLGHWPADRPADRERSRPMLGGHDRLDRSPSWTPCPPRSCASAPSPKARERRDHRLLLVGAQAPAGRRRGGGAGRRAQLGRPDRSTKRSRSGVS